MTPRRAGWLAGLVVAAGFLAVSAALHVRPGHPIAERTDVFFQSDAGGLIRDAVWNRDFRARGTHPLLYPLWTRPLHELARALAPGIEPAATATLLSRLLMALAAGVGVGALAGALVARGLPIRRALAFALLVVLAHGHTLAAIPDHFGLSVGAIGLAFAIVLSQRGLRFQVLALAALAPICAGITLTNALLPLGLLAILVVRHRRNSIRRKHVAALLVALVAAAFAARAIAKFPSIEARIQERIALYLNLRLVDDPVAALGYSLRGLADTVVAPTPHVATHNLDQRPMLTYEFEEGPRLFWPHDGLQTAGAMLWLALLGWGVRCGWRDPALRPATIGAVGWTLGNAVFHNIWGDEFFLYSPHYALPLLLIAAFGFRTAPGRVFYPWLAVVAAAALHTLRHYHTLLHGIAE